MQLITGSCGGERCINMAVTLREIIKQVQHLEMKLVAGETGLDHEVSWTHMVDSDTISAFLQGQELTFTTGLGLNENLTLLRLVKEVWRNKASGIVINTGPYISEIGQDVIDFANEKGFPVFEVPWRVRMAEIMRIICFAITKEQQNAIEVATALNNAFLCPSQEELYVSALMRKGYFTDSAYTVVNVCVLEDNDRVTGTRLEQILSKLSSHIRCNYNGILCCAQEKQILLVLCDYSDEACRKTTERIFQILCRMVCQKEQIFVSVSKQISGIRQIYKSYQFAEKMSDLLCVCQVPGEQSTDGGKIIFYKDLGIYRVLLTLTDKEAIKEYLADTVAPLYMEGVRALCDKYGILLICDEVMAGFYRTGKMFAFMNFDMKPDIITFAKGVTCGYVQLGGCIVSKKVAEYFEENVLQCGLTYSGHTLACAAGVAAMKYYKEHDIEGHVAEMHEIVAPFMDEMVKKHKCIGEARCIGLFGALEVVKNKETREPMQEYGVPGPVMPWIFAELKKRGFATFGRENFIEICPPLIITKEELEEYLPILDEVLTMVDEKFCD